MQLGRVRPRGPTALRRPLVFTHWIAISRNIPLITQASKRTADDNDGVLDEARASRRSLFNRPNNSEPPTNGENGAEARRQDLIDIHKGSLKDAGIELSPYEIERNRLHSMRQSLRRETRGAARAAVSRDFKEAERRLYSTYRRRRDDDEEQEEGDEGRRGSERRRGPPRGPPRESGPEGSGRRDERPAASRERRLDPEYRGGERGPARRRFRDQQDDEGRGPARRRFDKEGEDGDRKPPQRQRQQQRPVRSNGSEPRLPPRPRKVNTEEQLELNRKRAAATAALAVAAMALKRKQREADKSAVEAVASAEGDSSDEDEMEEGEMGDLYSISDQIADLRGMGAADSAAAAADPAPALPATVLKARIPKLSHNLPEELNLRLLETVMAGSKASPLPEVPVGASGMTRGLIVAIKTAWRGNELVKLRIRDRRKTAKKYLPYIGKVCETLESLTGGVVVWRSGRSIWMYRGQDFQPDSVTDLRANLLNKRDPPLEGPLLTQDKPLEGRMVEVAPGLQGYLTRGSAAPGPSDTAVLFLHDAFGLGASPEHQNVKKVCDQLATLTGLPVLLPDLLAGGKEAWRGKRWPPEKATYERLTGWMNSRDGRGGFPAVAGRIDSAVAYLQGPELGASRLALVGTGWGGWVAMHALATDMRRAAAALGCGDEAVMLKAAAKEEAKKAAKEIKAAAPLSPAERAEAKKEARKVAKEVAERLLSDQAVRAQQPVTRREAGASLAAALELKSGYGRPLVEKLAAGELDAAGAGLRFCAAAVATAGHLFDDEEGIARDTAVPTCFMSSKWDPMEKFQLHMNPPLVDLWAFKRFGKLSPGYFGKMANWGDKSQATGATQALTLIVNFLRWHLRRDAAAEALVRLHCMMGKSGVGEKQVYNQLFPWLPQVTLFRGHEKLAKKEKERAAKEAAERKEQELGAGEEDEEGARKAPRQAAATKQEKPEARRQQRRPQERRPERSQAEPRQPDEGEEDGDWDWGDDEEDGEERGARSGPVGRRGGAVALRR